MHTGMKMDVYACRVVVDRDGDTKCSSCTGMKKLTLTVTDIEGVPYE